MSEPAKLLTYQEAAVLLSMEVGTLYALVHQKRIPHIRFSGRMVRFDPAELEAWINRHRVRVAR